MYDIHDHHFLSDKTKLRKHGDFLAYIVPMCLVFFTVVDWLLGRKLKVCDRVTKILMYFIGYQHHPIQINVSSKKIMLNADFHMKT